VILAELEIDDFKQFAGNHRFEPSPDGIIGVIGQNGVGKTTLFEAIEWCLYQPREISNDEVWPRGRVAKPRVKVVLHDLESDVRYVVERTLRRGGATAEIYREDTPETRITHGSRQVSDYVARHLIGLSHRAFVSTFFTRQKELTFFGNLKETDRRREVGRLLGLETIRDAQQLISDEKNRAASEAKVLRAQHEDQSRDRDFAAESVDADRAVETAQAVAAEKDQQLDAATNALADARARLAMLREIEREDAEILRELERIAGDERAAATRRDAA
jgi:exonuclease SbcC